MSGPVQLSNSSSLWIFSTQKTPWFGFFSRIIWLSGESNRKNMVKFVKSNQVYLCNFASFWIFSPQKTPQVRVRWARIFGQQGKVIGKINFELSIVCFNNVIIKTCHELSNFVTPPCFGSFLLRKHLSWCSGWWTTIKVWEREKIGINVICHIGGGLLW